MKKALYDDEVPYLAHVSDFHLFGGFSMKALRSKISVAQLGNDGACSDCYYDQVHLHVTDYFKFPKPGDFMEIDPPALVR